MPHRPAADYAPAVGVPAEPDVERGAIAPRPTPLARRRRLNLVRIAWLAVALALLLPAAAMSPGPVDASRSCTGWRSTTRPPETIRVLTREGVVETVDFRRYVGIVMASGEWPSRLPKAMLEAGAVAVKQFAWYHSLRGNHRRGFVTADGECYDVLSTTRDQLYRPDRASVSRSQRNAIDATWRLSVRKNDRFILTQYNAGSSTECGSDANGRVIRQRSARDCARKGYSARRILRTYYGPGVTFKGSGGGSDRAEATPRSTPRPTPEPTPRERERQTPRPTPTPTPAPTLVPWWEVALGEEPHIGEQPDAATGPAGGADGGDGGDGISIELGEDWIRGTSEVRSSLASGMREAFRPLITYDVPSDVDDAVNATGVSFVGRSISVSGVPGPESSEVHVFIDGELKAMVDLHWEEPYSEVVFFTTEWDEPGPHTIMLVMLGPAERLRLELEAEVVYY